MTLGPSPLCIPFGFGHSITVMKKMLPTILEQLITKRIILASGSPRRRDILEQVGLSIEVIPSTFEENLSATQFPSLAEFVMETALHKVIEVSERLSLPTEEKPELVIGADTIVSLHGTIFGKPHTTENAQKMLRMLSGQTREVITGVVLSWPRASKVDKYFDTTHVKMYKLSEQVISDYVKTGEPLDKAGAYGIQGLGQSLVESYEGDFSNVVGFPFNLFCKQVVEHYKDVQI